MSLDKLYGSWDAARISPCESDVELQWAWHHLANQGVGTDRFMPNNGLSQRKNEIIELWKIYRSMQPRVVVEIGTAQGGTFAAWCRLGHPNATIISIDRDINDCWPRPGNPVNPEIYNGELKMGQDGGGALHLKCHQQDVHSINGWSYEEKTINHLRAILRGREIDFLWHDASHQPDTFAKDWKIYRPLMAEGAVFASHDIVPSADPNSNKSVEWERIKRDESFSAIYEFRPHPSVTEMGIGVIIL